MIIFDSDFWPPLPPTRPPPKQARPPRSCCCLQSRSRSCWTRCTGNPFSTIKSPVTPLLPRLRRHLLRHLRIGMLMHKRSGNDTSNRRRLSYSIRTTRTSRPMVFYRPMQLSSGTSSCSIPGPGLSFGLSGFNLGVDIGVGMDMFYIGFGKWLGAGGSGSDTEGSNDSSPLLGPTSPSRSRPVSPTTLVVGLSSRLASALG
ncbi:hypothetical protein GALMADRAFT_1249381 [Galerina marginata CBS 339.88]|uniref:Uncharacterized protein n=1 Tax=Galerina marginata (strain CBS 339.88) TaxID=685588 RepID=A0A067T7U1_GALM3|nr:hypothetical protein GALMADRAFT_1249381 [Galerina marginata CBS 339.88]